MAAEKATGSPAKAGKTASTSKSTAKSTSKSTPDVSDDSASESTQAGTRPRPLKVHHLRPAPGAHTAKTRVGRGGGSKGKTAGRGTKGTKARSQVPARFEGGQMPIHMRLPKLKGFTNRNRVEFQVVNLDRLAALFPDGGQIGPDELAAAGAVRRGRPVKILGAGDLGGVTLTVAAHAFSTTARDKIVAAGGTVTAL